MAYIYQIVNDINDKIYVGKTEETLEKRFYIHCKDAQTERCKNRPLYNAMNKYGFEHFRIEELEKTDYPDEREQYWIEKLNTYHNGYNATLGGDGKRRLDYDKIIERYCVLGSQKLVAEELGIDAGSVRQVLKMNEIPIIKTPATNKAVRQFTRQGEVIQDFISCSEGARWLISQEITQAKLGTVVNKITECANHKRKSAYGYLWEFV